MSSVRPKLKPDVPKAVTAWDTRTGTVVWMTEDGAWSEHQARAGVWTGDDAESRLRQAQAAEGTVTDPYVTEVADNGAITGRETLRETIRATGPTVAYGADAIGSGR